MASTAKSGLDDSRRNLGSPKLRGRGWYIVIHRSSGFADGFGFDRERKRYLVSKRDYIRKMSI